MPFLVTRTAVVRPNTDVNFYEFTEEELEYLNARYISKGVLHSIDGIVSEDGLTKTNRFVWYILSITQAYQVEEIVTSDSKLVEINAKTVAHNQSNNISRGPMFYEIRDDDGNIISVGDLPDGTWFSRD
jgi:hypothetical protein